MAQVYLKETKITALKPRVSNWMSKWSQARDSEGEKKWNEKEKYKKRRSDFT